MNIESFDDVDLPSLDEIDLDRFSFIEEVEWQNLTTASYCQGTMKKLLYVEALFGEWGRLRNVIREGELISQHTLYLHHSLLLEIFNSAGNLVPNKSIVDYDIEELNRWIPYFLFEVRRKDSERYRAKTLFEFLLCLQSLFKAKRNISYSFLKEDRFLPIRNSLNNVMKELQAIGLGNNPKKVDVVSPLMEEELWSAGVLGDSSSRQLLRTLVYVLGLNLGLRTGEHRKLRRQMFEVSDEFLIIVVNIVIFLEAFLIVIY